MISRHWRGLVKTEDADNYVRHLQNDTFPLLSQIPGFVSASILRRTIASGVEFLIVTMWQSMDAIRQFTGESEGVAVVPPVAQAMMLEYDTTVVHYDVVGAHGSASLSATVD
jgi:heme-degrading monooxygenase HmoA